LLSWTSPTTCFGYYYIRGSIECGLKYESLEEEEEEEENKKENEG
jgi:hypothetical protein